MYDVYEIENNNMRVPFSDWVAMVSENDRERAIEHFKRFTTDGDESSIVFDIVTAKGNRKTIHASATIERDQFDDSVKLIGINKDITKQTQYENALKEAKDASEQASRTKSEFVANMSHEIRTPMNAIIGLLALLRKTSLTEKQIDYVSKSDLAARSLLRILNDILDLSKIEAGKLDIDPHPFNLHDLAGNVASLLSTSIEKKELELRIDVDPALPKFVTLDSYRLQQILINLAGNAIKFTTKGYVAIKLSLDKTSDHILHVEVVDTGIGIAKDKHASVFEAFNQAETSTVRAFGGTGLGLVISKTLVELMGGEISLESIEGSGSTFKFYVPFIDGCDESSCSSQGQQDSDHVLTYEKRLQDVTILLVEDNPINRLVARESLEAEGATILTAENGEQAVAAVKESGAVIDVVLMDVQMPIMDGYTATKEIRALKSFSDIPIIAMTANALLSDKKAAAQAGMDDHISKPFDIAQLVRIISTFTVPNVSSKDVMYTDSKTQVELSDFNHEAALLRLGDNKGILCTAAESYLAESETAMGSIPTVVTDDNVSDVMRAIHSLKGASLTIGAERIAEKLAELEVDLKRHKYEHYSAKVNETSELLVSACSAIRAYLSGQAKSVEQGHVVPKKESVTRLEIIELCNMLAQSNMKVLDICLELKRKDQGPYHGVLSEIDADVQNLDFRNAQARLERFLISEC